MERNEVDIRDEYARRLEKTSLACAALVTFGGVLTLLGYLFGVPLMKHLPPALEPLRGTTGLGFLLGGASLVAGQTRVQLKAVSRILAAGMVLLGLLGIAEHLLGFDFDLFRNAAAMGTAGREAPATAVNFVLLGLALILLESEWGGLRPCEWFALICSLSSLIIVLGYLYGVPQLYTLGFALSAASLHSAVLTLLLSGAVLFTHPRQGLSRFVVSDSAGGELIRRLLPVVILVPILLGWLLLKGEVLSLYDPSMAVALLVVAIVIWFSTLIGIDSGALTRADERRQRAERAVRDREEDLSVTLDSIRDAVIATDAGGHITRMNPAAERLTGWRLDEARTRPLDEVFKLESEERHQPLEGPFARVQHEGATVTSADGAAELVTREGDRRPIADSAAPIQSAPGALRGVVLVSRDLSDSRRSRDELRKSQARFARLSDSGIIGIAVTHLDGTVLESNEAFLTMVGGTEAELQAGTLNWRTRTPEEWKHTDEEAVELLHARGAALPWQKEFLSPSGARVPVLLGLALLEGHSCIAFAIDLTLRKRAEADKQRFAQQARSEASARKSAEDTLAQRDEQLRQAQKLEAIGLLAGGVAHDFNNLLSVILSYSATLLEDLEAGDPRRRDVAEIYRAGERAADLTRQLLAFSRRQLLLPRVVELRELIRGMERLLRRLISEDVEMSLIIPDELGRVWADSGQLEQVTLNLALNARDAMPAGGRLTIELSEVEFTTGDGSENLAIPPGPWVVLSVSDTGEGMDRETQRRIFEPFFTTKEQGKGTGLGLATVFGIVQQSHGHVRVHSETGKGSRFDVFLPRTGLAPTVRAPLPISSTLRGTETVLLVEDEENVRRLINAVLRKQGYQVLEAQNVGHALLICEQHPGKIDLLLTDVVMPYMSGGQLAERLARLKPDMKVLFVSGYAERTMAFHGVLEADVAFLQKPITPDLLIRKVRSLLDGGRPSLPRPGRQSARS